MTETNVQVLGPEIIVVSLYETYALVMDNG